MQSMTSDVALARIVGSQIQPRGPENVLLLSRVLPRSSRDLLPQQVTSVVLVTNKVEMCNAWART